MFPAPSMTYPSLAAQDPVDVLRLIRTLNVGPVTFFQLVARFGSAGEALAALPELSARGGRRTPLVACQKDAALDEIEATHDFGARLVLYGSPEYPQLLQAISDPPPLLTMAGHSHLWKDKNDIIAVVGARNASAHGCQFAGRISRELGEKGLTVVSGLARGIDTFVHKGSLATGTVAVIAGGINTVYPPENEALQRQIGEGGALISEQPFGNLPFSGSFPGRNRIIAGMSLGTVVVEASPKSGSLITARFAAENNREVFAVPGSPLDPRSKGCNQLIRQGATLVESVEDILQGIMPLRNQRLEETTDNGFIPARAATTSDAELAEARKLILHKLGITPVTVDELIEQCGIAPQSVLTILLELELAGRLRRAPGNKVYLHDALEQVA